MLGTYYADTGEKVTADCVRRKEFILGRAKMQCKSRGVVELDDGTVRTFSVRHDHNPDMHGNFRILGEPLRQSFEDAVAGLREFEQEWITEELPEWRKRASS